MSVKSTIFIANYAANIVTLKIVGGFLFFPPSRPRHQWVNVSGQTISFSCSSTSPVPSISKIILVGGGRKIRKLCRPIPVCCCQKPDGTQSDFFWSWNPYLPQKNFSSISLNETFMIFALTLSLQTSSHLHLL